jgi:cell fate regulator YaaT (PSP1 superfamily)
MGFLFEREELRREQRKLRKEKLRELYYSEIIIKMITDNELNFVCDEFGRARGLLCDCGWDRGH